MQTQPNPSLAEESDRLGRGSIPIGLGIDGVGAANAVNNSQMVDGVCQCCWLESRNHALKRDARGGWNDVVSVFSQPVRQPLTLAEVT